MIKPRIQIKLAVVGMVALIPMTAVPQATESAIEATPLVAEVAAGNMQQSGGENNMNSDFSENEDFQTLPYITANFEVEIQTRFNEIRSELLDEQALFIDRWLNVIAIILTFLGVVVAVATFVGFSRFRAIEKKANASVKSAAAAEEDAKHHLQKIQKISEKALAKFSDLDASFAAANPTVAYQTVTKIRDNPDATLIEKAIADALALQQQGKQEDAIEKWRAIAQITEESDNALAARAWFSIGYLSSDEDVADKLSSYNRAIQLKPNLFGAYVNRGIAKVAKGQYNDAIADYDIAIQLKPDFAEAYVNRGISYAELGRHVDAIADFDKSIELKPDMAEAYASRGISCAELGRHEDAITNLDIAIQLKPEFAEAYTNRGIVSKMLGRHEDAIADYDIAIQLKPDFAEAYTNRGTVYKMLGRHEDAITDLDKAIQLNPNMAEAYTNRGISYAELGSKFEAKSDLETALRLARNSDNLDLIKLVEQNLDSLSAINGD